MPVTQVALVKGFASVRRSMPHSQCLSAQSNANAALPRLRRHHRPAGLPPAPTDVAAMLMFMEKRGINADQQLLTPISRP